MRKTKSKADSINPEIDGMIKKMSASFDGLPPTDKINTIKVAIMWEKIKHSIKEDDEGGFFGNGSDEDDED